MVCNNRVLVSHSAHYPHASLVFISLVLAFLPLCLLCPMAMAAVDGGDGITAPAPIYIGARVSFNKNAYEVVGQKDGKWVVKGKGLKLNEYTDEELRSKKGFKLRVGDTSTASRGHVAAGEEEDFVEEAVGEEAEEDVGEEGEEESVVDDECDDVDGPEVAATRMEFKPSDWFSFQELMFKVDRLSKTPDHLFIESLHGYTLEVSVATLRGLPGLKGIERPDAADGKKVKKEMQKEKAVLDGALAPPPESSPSKSKRSRKKVVETTDADADCTAPLGVGDEVLYNDVHYVVHRLRPSVGWADLVGKDGRKCGKIANLTKVFGSDRFFDAKTRKSMWETANSEHIHAQAVRNAKLALDKCAKDSAEYHTQMARKKRAEEGLEAATAAARQVYADLPIPVALAVTADDIRAAKRARVEALRSLADEIDVQDEEIASRLSVIGKAASSHQ